MFKSAQSKCARQPLIVIAIWVFFVGYSFLPTASLAISYPVSGVWVAGGNHTGVCAALKRFKVDAFFDQSFPRVIIFSEGTKFDVSGKHRTEQIIRSAKGGLDGGFRITEFLSKKHRWPWSKKRSYTLRVINQATIEITEGNISTRFTKCSREQARSRQPSRLAG
jgi:hypothetical protein